MGHLLHSVVTTSEDCESEQTTFTSRFLFFFFDSHILTPTFMSEFCIFTLSLLLNHSHFQHLKNKNKNKLVPSWWSGICNDQVILRKIQADGWSVSCPLQSVYLLKPFFLMSHHPVCLAGLQLAGGLASLLGEVWPHVSSGQRHSCEESVVHTWG